MTNTNTAEAAVILAPMPRDTRCESPVSERRARCIPVRFRSSTSNTSTSESVCAGSGATRTTAGSGETRLAGETPSDTGRDGE